MSIYPPNVKLEYVSCPIGCAPNDILVLKGHDRIHGIPGEFNICRCQNCGLERTNPRPTQETVGIYYPVNYAPFHSSDVDSSKKSDSWLRRFLCRLLRLNSRELPPIPPSRMLEIGCSSGDYMESVRKRGWQVDGIEFSHDAANRARRRGFDVQVSSIEEADSPDQKYDVIAAWMVLEHLHEPLLVLRKLREWISAGGYLVAVVPDTGSISRRIFTEFSYDLQLPTHLFHYTPKTLTILLEESGWSVERVYFQRNCITFLRSCELWAEEREHKVILKVTRWLRLQHRARYFRHFFNMFLGVTRQSSRFEIWARPSSRILKKECP